MTGLSVIVALPPVHNPAAGTDACDRLAHVLGRIEECAPLKSQPFVWNIPSRHLFDPDEEKAKAVRRRLAERGTDQVVPMGFAGAPLELLQGEELASEITWASANPWHSGCVDCDDPATGANERLLTPIILPAPGSYTPRPTNMDSNVAWLCRFAGKPVIASTQNGTLRLLPVVEACALNHASPAAQSRSLAREVRRARQLFTDGDAAPVVLLLQIGAQLPAWFSPLLESIGRFTARNGTLAQLPVFDAWKPAEGALQPWRFARARDMTALVAAANIRKGRGSRASRRRILQTIAGDESGESAETEGPDAREFVASMMGDVALAGPIEDALFSGGRFSGFATLDVGSQAPLVSMIRKNDGNGWIELEPVSCFSFEARHARGVRSIARAASGDNGERPLLTLTSEYSFVNERPFLVSSFEFQLPPGDVWNEFEIRHLVLRLGEADPVQILARYPDGRESALMIEPDGPEREICGSRFLIGTGDRALVVAFLTCSGAPLVVPICVDTTGPAKLAAGGRFSFRARPDTRVAFAVIIGAGEESVHEIEQLTAGRMPQTVLRELSIGPPRPTGYPHAPREMMARET